MDNFFLSFGYVKQLYYIICKDTRDGCFEGLVNSLNHEFKICGMQRSSLGPHLEEIWEDELTIIGDGGVYAPVFDTIARQKAIMGVSFSGFDTVARPFKRESTNGLIIKHLDSLTEETIREWSHPLTSTFRGEWDYRYVFVETDRGKPYVFETEWIFPYAMDGRGGKGLEAYYEWLDNLGKRFLKCERREFEMP